MATQTSPTGTHRRRHLRRRIALHTSSLLIVLAGGFMPLPVQMLGQAYDIHVSAKVSAPPLTEPAIITSPADGAHVSDSHITVSGSCPDDSYVMVYVGSTLAGVATCTGNAFSVPAILAPGANTVNARVFNRTDDEGPTSPSITVYYDPPVAAKPPTTPKTSPTSEPGDGKAAFGLSLTKPYEFDVKHPGDEWQWELQIGGGDPPYRITIDWGDGTIEHLTKAGANIFTIAHVYNQGGTYQVLVAGEDEAGSSASLQLPAEVRELPVPIVQFMQSLFQNVNPWLGWPVYTLALAGVAVFWGFELRALHRHMRHKHRRAHA